MRDADEVLLIVEGHEHVALEDARLREIRARLVGRVHGCGQTVLAVPRRQWAKVYSWWLECTSLRRTAGSYVEDAIYS